MENEFKKFYFNGNEYFGYVSNQEDVNKLLKQYNGDFDMILRAKEIKLNDENYDETESKEFGLYKEYRGDLTLKEWLIENNMFGFFTNSPELKKPKSILDIIIDFINN